MEKTLSRVLIETVVKTTLKHLKEDPERGIRRLVDMALRFSGGRFQQSFFQMAQAMLENENSPYYALARDLISYADTDRLLQFGMALGYNSCTLGARRIRDNEARLGYNIPWAVSLQLDDSSPERPAQYSAAVSEGERLGIYTWMLFPSAAPEKALELVQGHPDSAFFLFCGPEELPPSLLDGISELKNLMPVLLDQEAQTEDRARLRALGVPYCAWFPYGRDELAAILDGDRFVGVQQTGAVITALIPRPDCPEDVRRQARQAVERARNEQLYQTIPWELEGDSRRINEIISGGACAVRVDRKGRLLGGDGSPIRPELCLFDRGLAGALAAAYPKMTASFDQA